MGPVLTCLSASVAVSHEPRFDALSGFKERRQRTTASESSSDCTVGVPGELLGFEKTHRPVTCLGVESYNRAPN